VSLYEAEFIHAEDSVNLFQLQRYINFIS